MIVFDFTAEPSSPELITYVDVRHEDEVTVCRDGGTPVEPGPVLHERLVAPEDEQFKVFGTHRLLMG